MNTVMISQIFSHFDEFESAVIIFQTFDAENGLGLTGEDLKCRSASNLVGQFQRINYRK